MNEFWRVVGGSDIESKLATKGYNYVRDLFPRNILISEEQLNAQGFTRALKNRMAKILDNIPIN